MIVEFKPFTTTQVEIQSLVNGVKNNIKDPEECVNKLHELIKRLNELMANHFHYWVQDHPVSWREMVGDAELPNKYKYMLVKEILENISLPRGENQTALGGIRYTDKGFISSLKPLEDGTYWRCYEEAETVAGELMVYLETSGVGNDVVLSLEYFVSRPGNNKAVASVSTESITLPVHYLLGAVDMFDLEYDIKCTVKFKD